MGSEVDTEFYCSRWGQRLESDLGPDLAHSFPCPPPSTAFSCTFPEAVPRTSLVLVVLPSLPSFDAHHPLDPILSPSHFLPLMLPWPLSPLPVGDRKVCPVPGPGDQSAQSWGGLKSPGPPPHLCFLVQDPRFQCAETGCEDGLRELTLQECQTKWVGGKAVCLGGGKHMGT